LQTGNVAFKLALKVTKICNLAKKDGAPCQQAQIDANLTSGRNHFHGLKPPEQIQLLRQNIREKEEGTNGEYDVDMTRYFKLLSSEMNKTIFEEE
jgi:hypothetical protein